MYKRILDLNLFTQESCFLWGPRQTGKSTLLKQLFPEAKYYDLLLSDQYHKLLRNPGILREELLALEAKSKIKNNPVIIDEVQKIPILLDEIQWLITNTDLKFILCGSSARKLKRGHGNLLGGRAIRYELHPLVYPEVDNFFLNKALNAGMLPRHYLSQNPRRLIKSYVGDYLKEEILAEALTRNISAFSRFLEIAAICNGEMINYNNIASDCGISAPTVKEYFQILDDTLLGRYLHAYRKRMKRRLIQSPKFYFFDIGIVAELTHRGIVESKSELFGKVFEHYIFTELLAHSHYSEKFYDITYWRTASNFEVDFILAEHEVAIEVKSASSVKTHHLKGLQAFNEEYRPKKSIVVSFDDTMRKTSNGIQIIPWETFLKMLWNNEIIK